MHEEELANLSEVATRLQTVWLSMNTLWGASIIADATALSLLIDEKAATLEQVVERIQKIQRALPEHLRTPAVTERTNVLVEVLRRGYGPKPGKWKPVIHQGGLVPPDKRDQ